MLFYNDNYDNKLLLLFIKTNILIRYEMQVVAGFLLLFTLILIHEFGHFIVAKAFKVRVLVFSIGFGYKLMSFNIGDTEYRICMIPLGGYVSLYGYDFNDIIPDNERKHSFKYQSMWKKTLIIVAGPFINFIFPVLLIFIMYVYNHKNRPPIINNISYNYTYNLVNFKLNNRIINVDNYNINSISNIISVIFNDVHKLMKINVKSNFNNNYVMLQKILIPKFMLNNILFLIKKPMIYQLLNVNKIYDLNLNLFDYIYSMNDMHIYSSNDILSYIIDQKLNIRLTKFNKIMNENHHLYFPLFLDSNLSDISVDNNCLIRSVYVKNYQLYSMSIQKIIFKTKQLLCDISVRQKYDVIFHRSKKHIINIIDSSIMQGLHIKNGDVIISINGILLNKHISIINDDFFVPNKMYVLGVISNKQMYIYIIFYQNIIRNNVMNYLSFHHIGFNFMFIKNIFFDMKDNLITLFLESLKNTYYMIIITIKSLIAICSNTSLSSLGGPISIFNVAGKAAIHSIDMYFIVMGLISINLGLLNLLPIPFLDGGYLLIFLVEFIIGRSLSLKFKQVIMKLGLLFLIIIMLLALFNDILRVIL